MTKLERNSISWSEYQDDPAGLHNAMLKKMSKCLAKATARELEAASESFDRNRMEIVVKLAEKYYPGLAER